MKSAAVTVFCASALALGAAIIGIAEGQQAPASPNDPRVGLKAGLHDAALEQGHEEISLNFEDSTEQQHSSAERPEEGGAP